MEEKYSKDWGLNVIDSTFTYIEDGNWIGDEPYQWEISGTSDYNFKCYINYTYYCPNCNVLLNNVFYKYCPQCGYEFAYKTKEDEILEKLEEIKRLLEE